MPWYAIDEARVEDQILIQLADPQQSDASGVPASAAIAPAPPAAVQAGAHGSSPSSEAMRGLNCGPLRSEEVQRNVEYEDVYADEDGERVLIDEMYANGMNANTNNELRVKNVGDLNDMHVVNGLGTNDDFLNVNGNDPVYDNANGMPVSAASVRVSAASAPSMQVGCD